MIISNHSQLYALGKIWKNKAQTHKILARIQAKTSPKERERGTKAEDTLRRRKPQPINSNRKDKTSAATTSIPSALPSQWNPPKNWSFNLSSIWKKLRSTGKEKSRKLSLKS